MNYGTEEFQGGLGRTRHGSPTFYKLLQSMADTHDKKSHDYASNSNPSGNYHFAGYVASLFNHSHEDAGFAGRVAEKIYRLSILEGEGKKPLNESIEDTEVDICTIVALWMSDRRDRRYKGESSQKEQGIAPSPPSNEEVLGRSRLACERIIGEWTYMTEQDVRQMADFFRRTVSDWDARKNQYDKDAKTSR